MKKKEVIYMSMDHFMTEAIIVACFLGGIFTAFLMLVTALVDFSNSTNC